MPSPFRLVPLTVLLFPTLVLAQITPVSQFREVEVTVEVTDWEQTQGDGSYYSESSFDLLPFNVSNAPQIFLPEGYADSHVYQESSFLPASIQAEGNAYVDVGCSTPEWYARADVRNIFEVVFTLSEATDYDLSGTLTSSGGGSYLDFWEWQTPGTNLLHSAWGNGLTPFSFQGTLPAGQYRIAIDCTADAEANEGEFWQLDATYDLTFSTGGATSAPPPHAGPAPTFLTVGPNPMRDSASIRYAAAGRGHVQIDVFDVLGRRVRRLANDAGPEGVLVWNGRSDVGSRLPGGVYFLRMQTGQETRQKKVLLTR